MPKRRKKRKELAKSVLCHNCNKRFASQKAGGGLARKQECPFCFHYSEPPKNVSALKKEAWEACAIYVKLKWSTDHGQCECVTCGKVMDWDSPECHAGHFLPGRRKGLLFDTRGIHPQCAACNDKWIGDGRPDKYFPFMIKVYGQDVVNELCENARVESAWTREALVAVRDRFLVAIRDLVQERNLNWDFSKSPMVHAYVWGE